MSIGFTFPFQQSTGSLGHFRVTRDELDTISADLRSLLETNWGERVMHYNFGCNFREFIFEQIRGDELKGRIADRVISQVSLWLPFVLVVELNIFLSEDTEEVPENGVGVSIDFALKNKPDLRGRRTFIVTA